MKNFLLNIKEFLSSIDFFITQKHSYRSGICSIWNFHENDFRVLFSIKIIKMHTKEKFHNAQLSQYCWGMKFLNGISFMMKSCEWRQKFKLCEYKKGMKEENFSWFLNHTQFFPSIVGNEIFLQFPLIWTLCNVLKF